MGLASEPVMRLPTVLAAALLSTSATVLPRTPVPPAPVRTTMHPAVRAVLETKMEAHALEMTDLMMLVVLLERDDAAMAAERIAAEPRIGRALDRNDANAGVPPAFLVLQDDLVARAEDVSRIARTGTDAELAKAFGDLTQACVGCHSRFLRSD